MICPSCASDNSAGAKFCNECGAALEAGCPSCGATNKPGAKFCSECGTALTGGPARQAQSQQPPAAQAERRLVTVLFADLVGFTPFAEERDAEDVRDTLSSYFELCSEIVTRYGGTIEKYIGDAVMAVWGAPVAHEDDPERAVRAALDLVDRVTLLAPNAQARAGVLTGEAAVTLGATNQGMVAGDMVNTAARLQSVAEPGTVLVGESTYRSAGQAINYEPVGDQTLKGKKAPVPAWRAMRVVAELGGRNKSESLEAPFVGRSDELRLLKDVFHATAREKRIRLVSVIGPAGIGKSRLAWEFSKYTDGLVEDTYWHLGRSPAYGEGVTFWALGEMIRRRCELVEGDDEPTTRDKVRETVERWIEDSVERDWVERSVLTLLGFESGMAPDQLFAAWRTLFERIAQKGTVALIFEDMHHADSGLLDFVDHLLEWSRGLPIFIMTLARPELLERRTDWGAGKRSFMSIHLEPLSDDHIGELLTGLVPGLPGEAVARIVERADGIPLYAVETVRMLITDGRLRREGDAYVPAGDLDALAVPETLTALIASRLDALAPADRSLLHDAAVLGQSFGTPALAALSGREPEALEEQLRGLVRRELVGRDVDPLSPERGQYVFVQALIREVAYNMLSKRDRKERHLAAARFFEQLGSDELASALANHYLAAHQNAPAGAEADALAVQARIALRAAADRAVSLGGHDQAIVFLEQAIGVTQDDTDRAELMERAAASATAAGHIDMAVRYLQAAVDIHVQRGDRLAAARAGVDIGRARLNHRLHREGLEALEQVEAQYGDLWPNPIIVHLRVELARAYFQLEQSDKALEIVEGALAEAEHRNLVPTIAQGLIAKGGALGNLGRLREATALFEAAERLAGDHSLSDIQSVALLVGGFHLGEIDAQRAMTKFQEGLVLSRRTGQRYLMLTFLNNLAYTSFLIGDWDEAIRIIEDTLDSDLPVSHRAWLIGNNLNVRASRGEDITEGLAELDGYVVDQVPDVDIAAYDARANARLAQGQPLEARDAWRKVAEIQAAQAPSCLYEAARGALWARDVGLAQRDLADLDQTGVHGRIVELRRQTIAAGIAALDGRSAEAGNLFREAIRGWNEVGLVWDATLTGLDMAFLLGADADQQIVAATRETLVRLRAQPFLERLDAARAEVAPQPAQRPIRKSGAVTAEPA